MSIVEKLKHMIASRGGDPKGIMTIADGVDRLEKTDSGSGSSDVMVVTCRIDHYSDQDDPVGSSFSMTASEVTSAVMNGKLVQVIAQLYTDNDFDCIWPFYFERYIGSDHESDVYTDDPSDKAFWEHNDSSMHVVAIVPVDAPDQARWAVIEEH